MLRSNDCPYALFETTQMLIQVKIKIRKKKEVRLKIWNPAEYTSFIFPSILK